MRKRENSMGKRRAMGEKERQKRRTKHQQVVRRQEQRQLQGAIGKGWLNSRQLKICGG